MTQNLPLFDSNVLSNDASPIIKPKPFVKWVGGKRQLLPQFKALGLFPPASYDMATRVYHEPFVGGGAAFFDLLPSRASLSDLNQELITAYKMIQCNVEDLITSLDQHVYDKDYYLEVRSRRVESLTDIEVASRFIFLNRTGFNGMYRVNRKGQFNVPFGRYTNPIICDADNLRRASLALQNVSLCKADFRNVLNHAERGDFVYFDPPYYPLNPTSSFTTYTSDGFSEQDQVNLRDTFQELSYRGCHVLLSNSYTPFIVDLYRGLEDVTIYKVEATRAINSKATGRGKIPEVVVANY